MDGNFLMRLRNLIVSIREGNLIQLTPLIKDWEAMVRLHFLYAAIESGLIEELNSPSSKQELKERLGVNRIEILEALLDLGISCGEISLKDGIYSLSGKRVKALKGNNGDAVAALIQGNVTYYNYIYQESAGILRGDPKVDLLDDIGEIVARYSKLVEPYIAPVVIDSVVDNGKMRYLDVGCGTGIYLKKTAEANPQLEGNGIEMDPNVVKEARNNIQNWGIADRVSIIEGDIRSSAIELSSSYDLITLFNTIYYFEEGERRQVFNKLHGLLSDVGSLIIVSSFRDGRMDIAAANLNYATSCMNGCTPLPAVIEVKKQLSQCGFDQMRTETLLPGGSVKCITAT